MEMKIPLVAISAFVVVVVLAAVLMPILDDATATTDTFSNESGAYGHLRTIDDDSEYTMTWTVSNPDVAVVNGEDVALYPGTLICGGEPNFLIRFYSGGSKYMQGRDSDGHNFTANSSLSITISGGTITIVSDTSTTTTYTLISGFALDNTGEYVMKAPTQKAYMNADTEYYAYGLSDTDTYTLWLKINGSIEDGPTFTPISGPTGTFSNEAMTYSEVAKYLDLYELTDITMTFTNTGTGVDTNMKYNFFIVPAEVTAERAVHLDGNEIALLAAVPALVIIALLIGVLAIFVRSKMD